LEVSQVTVGFATEVRVTCNICKQDISAIKPKEAREELQGPGSKGMFMKYAINYSMVLVMQHLGMGLKGLMLLLAFLGIAPGIGDKQKWHAIQEAIGVAQQELQEEIICKNIELEISLMIHAAKERLEEWLETEDGCHATTTERATKLDEFCYKKGDEYNLVVGMDGA
jgi:hypothetical protein